MIQNYSDPIVTLNQVYKAREAGTTPVLGACIIGPNYLIRDYQDFGEALCLNSDENYSSNEYSNSFSYTTGLSVRPLPAMDGSEKEYKDVRVFVKNAKLNYITFTVSSGVVVQSNSRADQLSIKTQQDSDSELEFIKFIDPDSEQDLYAIGDQVVIDLEGSDSTTYSQICQIAGFGQANDSIDYTKCLLSKSIKTKSTDTVKKITFFRYMDCYVREEDVSNSEDQIAIRGNTRSEQLSLADETAATYPIYGGKFYAEYRAFSTKYAEAYGQLSSIDDVEEMLGKISAENPLGIAVASAVQEANGNFVYFVALEEDAKDELKQVDAYNKAAKVVAGVDGIHGIVPCTNNNKVLSALLNYVEQQSAEQIPYFKYLYGSADLQDKRLIEGCEDISCSITTVGEISTITIKDSTLLKIKDKLVKDDLVGYGNNAFAKIKTSDNRYTLTTEKITNASVIKKISLYKALKKAEDKVDALIADKKIYNKRASIVFADVAMYQGVIKVPNYCVAAALAGLRSASAPHAPLSNVVLTTITCAQTSGITKGLSDKLGAYGFWRVGKNVDGDCISKRQLTSAATGDVNYDEQSIVTNIDSICLDLKSTGRSYVGNTNISGALLDILEDLLTTKLDSYKTYADALIGPQLLSGSVISLTQDPVYKDRIYASLDGEPPKPFNQFHITFYML